VRPGSLGEAFALLAEYGDEARLLAGGQTLLATLNMRLSEPAMLIDINDIAELHGIQLQGNVLRINAMARHSQIEHSPLVAQHAPLLTMAASHIGHRAIRNRGTWGGSIAYADPAGEWPACALALDAEIIVGSAAGERRIPAADFYVDLYTTTLAADEIVLACELPVRTPDRFHGFEELSRRHGDYAIVGLACNARCGGQNMPIRDARLALLGVCATPVRARRAEAFLEGKAPTEDVISEAAAVLQAELDGERAPLADLTNSPATKRHLAAVLLRRVVGGMADGMASATQNTAGAAH